jgi:CubicO group peptidase (beta-lactamase class C family)
MRFATNFLFLLLGCSAMAEGQQSNEPPTSLAELRQRVETVVDETKVPAVAIALVNRDGPTWVAGWGKANVQTGRPADEKTLFRIGSISKMFAAFAVLKLVEEGKLSLDDKVRDRAPEVAFENRWEDTHPVRVVHLLEHTTGWDDTHFPEYGYDAPDEMSVKAALEFHPHSRTSRWMPGTRFSYCNSGASVAAYIVEKVTGQRFEDYVAATFFEPLGMASTTYFEKGYAESGATLYLGPLPQKYWRLLHRAAGSINSSAEDMAKLAHFLLLRGATPSARILAEASIDRMELPLTTLGSAAGITAGYGLANYSAGHKNFGIAFRGHNGGVMGGLSELMYVKELGEGYVVMINSGNGAALGRITGLLKDYLLRNRRPPQVPAVALPAEFTRLDGYYQALASRQQFMRFQTDLLAIMKVTHEPNYLHRSPLFGGWTSSDVLGSGKVLIDGWHGLPAIAIVEDPLVGPALQINSDLYRRVPAWLVFGRLATVGLLAAMTLVGTIAAIVWGSRKAARIRNQDQRLWLRLWPLLATGTLLAFFILLSMSGAVIEAAGSVSMISVTILLLSLAYPVVVLLAALQLFRPVNTVRMNLPYWFAAAFVIVHLLVAGYLARYGVIGIRTWA